MTMRVPFDPSSVSLARQQLRAWMSDHGTSHDTIDDARIVISELVGNAIRHAQPLPDGNLVITWGVDDRGLRLSVTDGGSPSRPHRVNASSSAVAGRGMAIVDTLSLDWWAEESRTRSTVHALVPLS